MKTEKLCFTVSCSILKC